MTGRPGIRLVLGPDRNDHITTLARSHGGCRGVDAVLDDLNREASPGLLPVSASGYGFRWNSGDMDTEEWWPQGITTSADASDTAEVRGRNVVVVGWYAQRIKGTSRGTRLSFVDISDPERPRYRHVRLVQTAYDADAKAVTITPVRVHAGGIVWYGPAMLVADTRGGIRTFVLDDIIRVDGDGYDGYRYILPQRSSYRAEYDPQVPPFRFSFVSLDRSGDDHQLLAGEYGINGESTRLVRFAFDADNEALSMQDNVSHPLEVVSERLEHMQGATVVRGTYYLSTSRGRHRRGSLWVRRPGQPAKEHRATLAVGPEDLTYWPQRDELWNCSEYPGHRFVYAMNRSQFE